MRSIRLSHVSTRTGSASSCCVRIALGNTPRPAPSTEWASSSCSTPARAALRSRTRVPIRVGLYRYQRVLIVTAAAIVLGWLVRLDRVTLGPLECRRVRGSVSEQFIGDQVLLGMSFLRHFEIDQRVRTLTLRAPVSG